MSEGASPEMPPVSLPRGQLLMIGSGGIEVSALPGWVTTLRHCYGWSIRVCLTRAADALVSRQALAACAQAPVWGPDWPTELGVVPHQELAEWADLILVAPASTNFVAKCALGLPDSLALSTVINATVPVLIAPAIPAGALRRPSVQRHLATLTDEGYHLVPARSGISLQGARTGPPRTYDMSDVLELAAKVTG